MVKIDKAMAEDIDKIYLEAIRFQFNNLSVEYPLTCTWEANFK